MQDLCSIKLMKAIITVVGSDQKGIIARVSAILAENNINIADISQTILSGNFVMMMMVELQESKISIDELRSKMEVKAPEYEGDYYGYLRDYPRGV